MFILFIIFGKLGYVFYMLIIIEVMSLEIPKDYPLVVGVALAMSWQMFTQGFALPGLRKKIFNKEFMEKEFGAQHKN